MKCPFCGGTGLYRFRVYTGVNQCPECKGVGVMEREWTADAIMVLAHEACSGSKWRPQACHSSVDRLGYWEVRFKHERGDYGCLLFSDRIPATEAGVASVLGLCRDMATSPIPWPDWKPGDPIPHYVLAGMERARLADSFPLGSKLMVVAIDLDSEHVVLQPSHGPWNLPGARKAEPWRD